MKTETIEEFLKRGGKITKVKPGEQPPSDNFAGPTRKPKKLVEYNDIKDGLSPNLRWLGGRSE